MNGNCPCGQPLPPRHRKYCESCSSSASLIWKRRERQAYRGTAYWLDYWLTVVGDPQAARQAYNAYMRSYMRAYRKRQHPRRDDQHYHMISDTPDAALAD